MKRIVTICLLIIIVMTGCGTAEQQKLATETLEASIKLHEHQSSQISLSSLPDPISNVNGNSKGIEDSNLVKELKENNNTSFPVENVNHEKNDTDNGQELNQSQEQSSVETDVLLNLVDKYNHMFDRIEQDVNFDTFSDQYIGYKFKTIKTKEQLYEKFADFMTVELARKIWEDYVNQGEDGLYLIPMDGHPKVNINDSYTVKQIDQSTYQLQFRHESELHGIFDMNFIIHSNDQDKYIIKDITMGRGDGSSVPVVES